MSVTNAVNTTLYSAMNSATALTGLLSGTTAIYYQLAPSGATLPYVVFNMQAGGPDNDNPHDTRTQIYYIRGFAVSPALAGSIDAQIATALHRKTLSVSGYTNTFTWRETDIALVETTPENEQIYSAGATYRIRLAS